jgi:hypothetical protein
MSTLFTYKLASTVRWLLEFRCLIKSYANLSLPWHTFGKTEKNSLFCGCFRQYITVGFEVMRVVDVYKSHG